jgi:hypothetical protein
MDFDMEFSIIVINETWFDDTGQFSPYSLPNYTLHTHNRENGVGGGIAIYVHNNVFSQLIDSIEDGYEKLLIKIKFNGSWIKVVSYYRPPKPENLDKLLDDVESELMQDGNLLLLGDCNINTLSNDKLSKEYKQLLSSYGACICNSLETRPSSKTLLDHIILRINNVDFRADSIGGSRSDHNIVTAALNINWNNKNKLVKRKFTDFKKLHSKFKFNVDDFISCDAVNSMEQSLTNAIIDSTNKATTTRSFNVKNNTSVPRWYSGKILELMNRKDKILLKLRKHKDGQHAALIKKDLLNLEKIIDKEKRSASYSYFHNLLMSQNKSSSWKCINSILGKQKKNSNIVLSEIPCLS